MIKDAKFKVGDTVRLVKTNNNIPKFEDARTITGMKEISENSVLYFIEGMNCLYFEDELELVKEKNVARHVKIAGVGKDAPTVVNEHGGKQSQVLYRFDLADPLAMFEMCKVLDEGAKKYGEDENWRKIPIREHLNHLLIHAYAYLAGDTSDEHLSHIMCRAMFAQAVALQKEEEKDDLAQKTDGDTSINQL